MGSCKSKTRKPITFYNDDTESTVLQENKNDDNNVIKARTHLDETVDQILDEGLDVSAASRQRKNSSSLFGIWKLNKGLTSLSSGDNFKTLVDDIILYIVEMPRQENTEGAEDRYKIIISMQESDRTQRNDIEFIVRKRASGWSGEGKVEIKRRKSVVDPISSSFKPHLGNLQSDGDEPPKELERLEKEITKLVQFPDSVIASKVLITISKGSSNARFNTM